jgi:PAS domain S-box-containing protein
VSSRKFLASERTIQQLIDAAPDALVVVDITGAITLVNRAAVQLLGYQREELIGRSFVVLLAAHDRSTAVELLKERAEALPAPHATPMVEVVVRHKDGSEIPVEVSLNGVETGDRKLVVAALRDISVRRHLEQGEQRLLARERSARSEAEAAVRLRNLFLATVTHDLKQPLSTIKAWAELIDEIAAELGNSESVQLIRAWSQRISDSTTGMASALRELIDVSQLQLGHPLVLERAPVDLAELARRVAAEVPASEQAPIEIRTPAEPVVGEWDAHRLERVLHNLLGNALKYSPSGGQITLAVRREGDWTVLEVIDEGIGIPSSDLGNLFQWFQRGSNVDGVAAGTGLGLAGVRQIVEQHGGFVDVVSQEGKGSTFTVRLPPA